MRSISKIAFYIVVIGLLLTSCVTNHYAPYMTIDIIDKGITENELFENNNIDYAMIALKYYLNNDKDMLFNSVDYYSDYFVAFLSSPIRVNDSFELTNNVCVLFNLLDKDDIFIMDGKTTIPSVANGLVLCGRRWDVGNGFVIYDLDGKIISAIPGDSAFARRKYPSRRYIFDYEYNFSDDITEVLDRNFEMGELNLYQVALSKLEDKNTERTEIVFSCAEESYSSSSLLDDMNFFECILSDGTKVLVATEYENKMPTLGYAFKTKDYKQEWSFIIDSAGNIFRVYTLETKPSKLVTPRDKEIFEKAENLGYSNYRNGKDDFIIKQDETQLTTIATKPLVTIDETFLYHIYPVVVTGNGLRPAFYLGVYYSVYDLESDVVKDMADKWLLDIDSFWDALKYNNYSSEELLNSINDITFNSFVHIDPIKVVSEYVSENRIGFDYLRFYDISEVASRMYSCLREENNEIAFYCDGEELSKIIIDSSVLSSLSKLLQFFYYQNASIIESENYNVFENMKYHSFSELYREKVNSFPNNPVFSTSWSPVATTNYSTSSYVAPTYSSPTFYSPNYYSSYVYATRIGDTTYASFSDGNRVSVSNIGGTLFSHSSTGLSSITNELGGTYYSNYSNGMRSRTSSFGDSMYTFFSDGTLMTTMKIGDTYYVHSY